MKKILFLMLLGCHLVFLGTPAFSDDAADVDTLIKTSMNDVLAIAKHPDTPDEQKRKELWQVVLRTFDFEKITEFTLGQFSYNATSNLGEYADRRFSKEQQAEFRELFTKHLGNNYLDRLDFKNVDVDIQLKPAEILEPKKGIKRAQAGTMINSKTPIDYMLLNEGKAWKVYDIKVEGRSLVSAFRNEYKTILLKDKPVVLIRMLKDKIAEHEAAKKIKP
ncbi:MAG: ABC transporter substrate-binding protein [Proteobacteria bacterium]|nr:ABC transporter substrate-binding protein [Pseudomonadota bacterium]